MTELMENLTQRWRHLLVALLVTVVLHPCQAAGHSTEQAKDTPPAGKPARLDSAAGLDERLGAKIPLDLVFRDETGRPVRLAYLVAGPTIILPVYYGCSNVCNFLQGSLARTLPAVQRVPGRDFRVLSVSIDETETPQLAARYKRMYLAAMNAPFPQNGWTFLTGDAASIRRLTDAAGYRFQRQGHDFLHPVASFVIAGDGTIVRYLYGTTFLPKDLTLALIEAREGKVGTTIRKVVDYCFTFDPAGNTYVFNLLRVSATVIIICTGSFLLFLLITGRKKKVPPPEVA